MGNVLPSSRCDLQHLGSFKANFRHYPLHSMQNDIFIPACCKATCVHIRTGSPLFSTAGLSTYVVLWQSHAVGRPIFAARYSSNNKTAKVEYMLVHMEEGVHVPFSCWSNQTVSVLGHTRKRFLSLLFSCHCTYTPAPRSLKCARQSLKYSPSGAHAGNTVGTPSGQHCTKRRTSLTEERF